MTGISDLIHGLSRIGATVITGNIDARGYVSLNLGFNSDADVQRAADSIGITTHSGSPGMAELRATGLVVYLYRRGVVVGKEAA